MFKMFLCNLMILYNISKVYIVFFHRFYFDCQNKFTFLRLNDILINVKNRLKERLIWDF